MGLTPNLYQYHRDQTPGLKQKTEKFWEDHRIPDNCKAHPCNMVETANDGGKLNRFANFNGQAYSNATGDYEGCTPQEIYNLDFVLNYTDEQIKKYCAGNKKYNEEIKKKYEESGSKKSFKEWYAEWRDTPEGATAIAGIKTIIGGLLNKLFPKTDIPTTDYTPTEPQKILGMKPLVFGLVAAGTAIGLIAILVWAAKR